MDLPFLVMPAIFFSYQGKYLPPFLLELSYMYSNATKELKTPAAREIFTFLCELRRIASR